MVSIGVNHRDFQTVHQANSIYSDFAIVETVIGLFHGWPLENAYRILEGNMMLPEILPVLFVRPTIVQGVYLHNVNMTSKEKCIVRSVAG
jgi:hypothetical protein